MSDQNSIDHLPIEIQKSIKELEEYEKTCINSEMRMKALNWEMNIRDQIGRIQMVENAYAKGYAEGYAEGFAIGYVEQIAKNLKNLGVSIDIIAQVTDLNQETIEKL